MIERIKFAFFARDFRKRTGIPMRGWWKAIALPYIFTGRIPKLPEKWRIVEPKTQEKQ